MSLRIHAISGDALAVDSASKPMQADALWSDLDALAARAGFAHWSYCTAPEGFGLSEPGFRVTSYPAGHVTRCLREGLFAAFPGIVFAARSPRPARFGEVRASLRQTPRLRSLLALNREFRVTRGVVIPLVHHFGMVGAAGLVFPGGDRELDAQWSREGTRIVAELHELSRQILARHARGFAQDLLPQLSDRQRELARLSARGLGTREIARAMDVSVHTVDKHAAAFRRRLRARTTARATALAASWGLLDTSPPRPTR